MKYDIFISYSRKDSAVVQSVVDRLKAEGYNCWMDVNGIESGDAFKAKLVSAMKSSSMVVFFSSVAANNSKWTVKEINMAVHLNKPIIPVRLDESAYDDSIMFDLSGLDFIMFRTRQERDEGIGRLLHSVLVRSGGDSADVEYIHGEQTKNSIAIMKWGVALFVVAGTGLLWFIFINWMQRGRAVKSVGHDDSRTQTEPSRSPVVAEAQTPANIRRCRTTSSAGGWRGTSRVVCCSFLSTAVVD